MEKQSISLRRKTYITAMRVLMGISVCITCALVLFLIGYVLWKGLPNGDDLMQDLTYYFLS